MTKTVSDFSIRGASEADLEPIKALLQASGLPTDGVDEHLRTFIVAYDGERLVGCSGSEAYQFAALIRSVAVHPEYRSLGLGRRLVREMLDRLSSRGLREFYLLTIDAEQYFRKRGFRRIDRDEIHPQLLGSTELQGACPDTAVCMRLVMT